MAPTNTPLSPPLAEDTTATSRNVSFVLHGIDDVRFEERPVPVDCDDDAAIVAPKATGICGSDVHYLKHGRIGDFIVKDPMVLGHESAAVVVKVGKNVKNVKPGDRVALEPGKSCRSCYDCKGGHYERCPDMIFAATPPYDGTLAGRYVLPADLCYKLPDNMSMEEGALLEPMSVGVHAVAKVAELKPGSNVVVFGAGPVGLLTAAAAKGLGAARVIAVGSSRTSIPLQLPQEGEDKVDFQRRNAKEIQTRFGFTERGATGVDYVFECSGAEVCIGTSVFLLKHGGTMVQIGMGRPDISLDMHTVLTHELTIKGSFRYGPDVYRLSLDLVARGAVNLKSLITHRYTFKEAKEAFEANTKGVGKDGNAVIKIIIAGPVETDTA
ncbi:hypothetical protein C6P46_003053 [Rhodotorula mucilaginosa]|uniref:Enoyl reductase (ER) domain-containing protein n=1 Tax=Rhodotorula mucilaginosa TaxID=5537 RepID=A0A9P6W5A1_RHOMI|nr:hypothetical protein C6P46_003053 [Rhodotorula mucilaginosa]